jgi:hypothetical protein
LGDVFTNTCFKAKSADAWEEEEDEEGDENDEDEDEDEEASLGPRGGALLPLDDGRGMSMSAAPSSRWVIDPPSRRWA